MREYRSHTRANIAIMESVANPDKALRRFNDALRRVMSVSKEDLTRELANEKEANEGKPKRGPKPKKA